MQEPTDLNELRKWFSKWLKEDEKVLVHYTPLYQWEIVSMKSQGDGFIVSVSEVIPTLYAKDSGVVYFTGFTKGNGAMIRVKYDDGVDVTYGMLNEIHVLPYSVLASNDKLASSAGMEIYIEAWADGQLLTEETLRSWLLQ